MKTDVWSILWVVLMPIGVTALTLLLTGPGMWSEKWGWGWLLKTRRPPPDDER